MMSRLATPRMEECWRLNVKLLVAVLGQGTQGGGRAEAEALSDIPSLHPDSAEWTREPISDTPGAEDIINRIQYLLNTRSEK